MHNKLKHNVSKDYTVAPNVVFRDTRISFKAKGLWLQILSLSEGWNFSVAGLAKLSRDKESSIKSAIKELAEAGYLVWEKIKDDKGRFTVVVTTKLPEILPHGKIPHGKTPHGKLPHGKISVNKVKKNKVLNNKVKKNKEEKEEPDGSLSTPLLEGADESNFRKITETLHQSDRVKFLPSRKDKLKRRLKTFKIEEILQAATNLADSPFHRGENDNGTVYATFDFLMRNDAQIDKWLNASEDGKAKKNWDNVDISKLEIKV